MNRNRISVMRGLSGLMLALALPALAQSPQETSPLASRPVVNQAVTADEAVEIALRDSPVIRGAVAEVEVASARVRAARAERRPMVSATGFLTDGNIGGILTGPPPIQPQAIMGIPRDTFADLNVMLMAPLYTGGRVEAMTREASAMRGASEADLEAMRQEVALMTRTAYNEVIARQAMVGVWQARLREDEERLRQDRLRLQQESIPAYYIQRDEAEAAATRQELTNAERDVELGLLMLQTTMGVHPSSRLEVSGAMEAPALDSLIKTLVPESASQDPRAALVQLAMERRPEMRAANRRVTGAAAGTAAVRGSYRPQVSVTAMGDLMAMEGEDTRSGTTFGVVASLPLYTGGMKEARVREADAMRRQREQEREQTALRLAQDVGSALAEARAAERNVETARTELRAAQEEYKAAALRYQVGRSTVVEALDSLASQVRAESGVVQALFSYSVARDRLARSVGAMDPTR